MYAFRVKSGVKISGLYFRFGPLIDIRRRTARTLTQRCASSLRGSSNIVFEDKLSPA